jgi:hypothetical protein
MLQNSTLQKRYVQNSTVLQNGTYSYKTVHSHKQYMIQNGTLQNSSYKTVVTKRFPEKMVFYITVQYSHNQQGSTYPWIGWALSPT